MRIRRAANWAHRVFCLGIHVVFFCSACGGAFAQQSYAGVVGDCSISSSSTTSVIVGYTCSEAQSSCKTYAYYRTQEGQTLSTVATFFDTTISALTDANSLSSSSTLTSNQPLFVPLACSCSSSYSVAEIPYTIQPRDSFYAIANATFQGLTTCGGIQTSNPSVAPDSIQPGSSLTIPLRCACPSQEQLDQGTKLLITYPVVSGDNPSEISSAFGADTSHFQSANGFSQNAVIYPQTTVLIPLAQKPQIAPVLDTETSGPASPPAVGKSSHVAMYVGIAIGAFLALFLILVVVFCIMKKRKSRRQDALRLSEAPLMQQTEKTSSGFSEIDMYKINNRLSTYTEDEISAATQGFDPSHHVKGSVYRGTLREQVVAIKRIDRNITKEVSTFRNLHHSNLVPLWGVCIGSQESFLVYPFIAEGSLKEWLHEFPHKESPECLSWCGRMQIAADTAIALEYLHEYTKPSVLHKNVTSSNILVDANCRGKLSNFGLAKPTEDIEQGMARTSHIEGTQGYLAPEYLNDGEVSAKTDVFAFGVVLAEMLTGKNPIMRDVKGSQLPGKHGFLWEHMSDILQGDDVLDQEDLANWMDPVLKGRYPTPCGMKMSELLKRCVAKDPAVRPNMSSMAATLREVLEASKKWEDGGAHNRVLQR